MARLCAYVSSILCVNYTMLLFTSLERRNVRKTVCASINFPWLQKKKYYSASISGPVFLCWMMTWEEGTEGFEEEVLVIGGSIPVLSNGGSTSYRLGYTGKGGRGGIGGNGGLLK